MTHDERMKAIRNASDWLTRLTFDCSNEAKKEIDIAIEALAPITSGEMVIVQNADLRRAWQKVQIVGGDGEAWRILDTMIKASQE